MKPANQTARRLALICGNDPVNEFDPTGLAVGDLWDPRTYIFNPIGMSGTEAAGRARIARDATDKMLGYASLAAVAGRKEAGSAISSARELYYSYWTRMSRYYEMGVGEANVSIGNQLGAKYEAEGSMYFEMLPVIGSGYKSFKGEVMDDRGDGIRQLSTWGRVGYGTLAAVEAGIIASPLVQKTIAARSGSAAEIIPKTLAQEVGPVVNSTSSSAGAGGTAKTAAVGELRAQGLKDAHHVIQDAAVRDIPGYNTQLARGVQLPGPSTRVGTPHNLATIVQRQAGGGTYGAERRIGYKALRRANTPEDDARAIIEEADAFFELLGVTRSTPTRIPGNR